MSLAQRLSASIAAAAIGRVLGAILGLATTALATRFLGPELFGVYRVAFAWAITASTVANLGLTVVCLREIARPGADTARILGTGLTLRLAVGVFGVAGAAAVVLLSPAAATVGAGTLARATALAGVGCLATLCNELITTVYQRELSQLRATLAELAGGTVTLALTAVTVYLRGSLLAIVGAAAAGSLVTFLVAALLAQRLAPVRLRFDRALAYSLLVLGIPVFATDLVGLVTLRLDTVFLSMMSDPAQVGFYGVANKVKELGVQVPYLFAGFLMPILTRFAAETDTFLARLSDGLMAVWIFAAGCLLAVICFADIIVMILAGKHFAPAAASMQIAAVALAAGSAAAILQYAALALSRSTSVLIAQTISAVATLLGFFVLIPRMGAIGAAIAVAVGEAAFLLGLLKPASPTGLAGLPWSKLAAITAAAALCGALVMGIRALGAPLYVSISATALGYPTLLLLTGAVTVSQLTKLMGRSAPT